MIYMPTSPPPSASLSKSRLNARKHGAGAPSGDKSKAPTTPPESDGIMKRQQDSEKVVVGNGYALVKKVVRYRECRKNHAATFGGYAVDGCREFMAAGEEGTPAALKCAACSCHRSFHKREVEREVLCDCSSNSGSPR